MCQARQSLETLIFVLFLLAICWNLSGETCSVSVGNLLELSFLNHFCSGSRGLQIIENSCKHIYVYQSLTLFILDAYIEVFENVGRDNTRGVLGQYEKDIF